MAVGSVTPDGGVLSRVFVADGARAVPAPDPSSPVRLRALAQDGRVLEEIGVRVVGNSERPRSDGGNFAGPIPTGTAAVELVRDDRVLDRLERSAPPRVRVLAPRPVAASVPARPARRGWRASDPDGGQLDASVEFSPTAGHWRSVFEGASAGVARVPGASSSAPTAPRYA